ncbi:MAG: lipopolysaccharide core heptose(II) kinase RfaY [Lachnospiraceae bacterium]|nr:lipopolysaccharide core heptose(II) kinase RfaY [Lachnospiraceae bacterium]
MTATPEQIKAENDERAREIRKVLSKNKIGRGITPEKLRIILEELGPTYIKLGQIMSLHSDILPKAYCDELMKLNSEVTPMPFEDVEDVINGSYRLPWQDVFASIEHEPLGSASIAQVHKAVLLTGEEVVVKVERKGIYDKMARDIRLLHKAVKRLPPVGTLRNIIDLDMVLDELWQVSQEEMDFLKEAANIEEFAANNAGFKYIYVPKVYREFTTARVLVMEYVDGIAINDKDRLIAGGYDLDEIGTKFVNNYIHQIMDDGFFHADPHPGNVAVRDGKIVWMDMGMMGRLTERERKIMIRGVEGLAMRDVTMVTDAVLDLGKFWGKPDRDQLYRDLRDFIEEFGSVSMGQVDVAETLQAMMEVMKANKIGMPHGLTMLARGMSHVEGVLADISPDINMMQIAATSATEEMVANINWKDEIARTARHIYRSTKKSIDIPLMAADIMQEYLEGQARANLKLELSKDFAQVIFASIRNLVIGMCIVALLIASSILCLTDLEPRILGIPLLGAFGYFVAFLSTMYFFARYFWRKFIKKQP